MEDSKQAKGRLMVVDDDSMVLQTVTAIFEFHGFEVWGCMDSRSAIEMLERRQPDVMLTDIRMPGMSGTDLLLYLKNAGYKFPVIVMTGYADLDSAIDAVKGAAFDFIKKPYDPGYLVHVVERAVKHYRLLALEGNYVKQLEEDVKLKTVEIERALRLKTEFLHNMSHEIRTPANGIVGMISLARSSDVPEEVEDYLEEAERAAMQLARILDDIVTLSGVVTGSVAPKFSPLDIRNLVGHLISRVGEIKGGDIHRFDLEIDDEVPKKLLLEPHLIKMALFHLLENEVKYAFQGKVGLEIHYDKDKSQLGIIISDSGPGMSPEMLQQVSEPFVQGDGSSTRLHGGLGIGLNIVNKIAEFMKGEFIISSREGEGTEARLVLPAKPAL